MKWTLWGWSRGFRIMDSSEISGSLRTARILEHKLRKGNASYASLNVWKWARSQRCRGRCRAGWKLWKFCWACSKGEWRQKRLRWCSWVFRSTFDSELMVSLAPFSGLCWRLRLILLNLGWLRFGSLERMMLTFPDELIILLTQDLASY